MDIHPETKAQAVVFDPNGSLKRFAHQLKCSRAIEVAQFDNFENLVDFLRSRDGKPNVLIVSKEADANERATLLLRENNSSYVAMVADDELTGNVTAAVYQITIKYRQSCEKCSSSENVNVKPKRPLPKWLKAILVGIPTSLAVSGIVYAIEYAIIELRGPIDTESVSITEDVVLPNYDTIIIEPRDTPPS